MSYYYMNREPRQQLSCLMCEIVSLLGDKDKNWSTKIFWKISMMRSKTISKNEINVIPAQYYHYYKMENLTLPYYHEMTLWMRYGLFPL